MEILKTSSHDGAQYDLWAVLDHKFLANDERWSKCEQEWAEISQIIQSMAN